MLKSFNKGSKAISATFGCGGIGSAIGTVFLGPGIGTLIGLGAGIVVGATLTVALPAAGSGLKKLTNKIRPPENKPLLSEKEKIEKERLKLKKSVENPLTSTLTGALAGAALGGFVGTLLGGILAPAGIVLGAMIGSGVGLLINSIERLKRTYKLAKLPPVETEVVYAEDPTMKLASHRINAQNTIQQKNGQWLTAHKSPDLHWHGDNTQLTQKKSVSQPFLARRFETVATGVSSTFGCATIGGAIGTLFLPIVGTMIGTGIGLLVGFGLTALMPQVSNVKQWFKNKFSPENAKKTAALKALAAANVPEKKVGSILKSTLAGALAGATLGGFVATIANPFVAPVGIIAGAIIGGTTGLVVNLSERAYRSIKRRFFSPQPEINLSVQEGEPKHIVHAEKLKIGGHKLQHEFQQKEDAKVQHWVTVRGPSNLKWCPSTKLNVNKLTKDNDIDLEKHNHPTPTLKPF